MEPKGKFRWGNCFGGLREEGTSQGSEPREEGTLKVLNRKKKVSQNVSTD